MPKCSMHACIAMDCTGVKQHGQPPPLDVERVNHSIRQVVHLGRVEAGQGDAAIAGHEDKVLVGHVIDLDK